MTLYGSLQGPQILDSVDYTNLPLGRQRLRLVRIAREADSKDGASKNVNYLVASADDGVRGTAFFRFNFRHKPFNLGNEIFPSYLDPTFPTDALKRLERLAESEGSVAAGDARKEITRARIALSTLKKINTWAGIGSVLYLDTRRLIGTEFEGSIQYVDRTGNRMRLDKDGKPEFVDRKSQPILANTFDADGASAEVFAIFAAPKDVDQYEIPASAEGTEDADITPF